MYESIKGPQVQLVKEIKERGKPVDDSKLYGEWDEAKQSQFTQFLVKEIGFDMTGGEFTHEGDRCTLETLVHRTAVADAGLRPIVQIVHDIDLKDEKFGRPETIGISQVLAGLFAATSDDQRRLERGFALFDDLYASFRMESRPASRPDGSSRR